MKLFEIGALKDGHRKRKNIEKKKKSKKSKKRKVNRNSDDDYNSDNYQSVSTPAEPKTLWKDGKVCY